MSHFISYSRLQFSQLKRDYMSFFFTLIVPAAMYVFFGFLYGGETYGAKQVSYYDTYTPAMMAIIIFVTAFFSVGLQLTLERASGHLKRIMATPISASTIILSTVFRGIGLTIAGIILMQIIGYFTFDRSPPLHFLQFSIAFMLGSFAMFSIGVSLNILAKNIQHAMAINFIIFYPMLFLSGATIPLAAMPESMQSASDFIPLKYVVVVLQNAWMGELFTAASVKPVLVLTGLATFTILLAAKMFKWD